MRQGTYATRTASYNKQVSEQKYQFLNQKPLAFTLQNIFI